VVNPVPATDDARHLPLAACDCDNHVSCTVHCVVGDVDIDVDACGVWG
jgi:hypothetical protein